jgi:hypothetical protein
MPSAWITHVKKYAAENNVSYKEALSKASASYKKQKGEGCCDKLKEWRRGRNQRTIHPEAIYTPEEPPTQPEENEMNIELLKSPRNKNKTYVKPIEQPKKEKKKNKK